MIKKIDNIKRCKVALSYIEKLNNLSIKFPVKNNKFVVLDFETTGLNYSSKRIHSSILECDQKHCHDCFNEVVEVGIIQFKLRNNEIVIEKVFQKLYSPLLKSCWSKIGFNWILFSKLSSSLLREKTSILTKKNFKEFHYLIRNRIIIAHHSSFEKHFIEEIYKYNQKTPKLVFFDTEKVIRKVIPKQKTYSLQPVTTNFFNFDFSIHHELYHTALFDALASLKIFWYLINHKKI